jgi:hypothetical protein
MAAAWETFGDLIEAFLERHARPRKRKTIRTPISRGMGGQWPDPVARKQDLRLCFQRTQACRDQWLD